jgi:hypothetical protein
MYRPELELTALTADELDLLLALIANSGVPREALTRKLDAELSRRRCHERIAAMPASEPTPPTGWTKELWAVHEKAYGEHLESLKGPVVSCFVRGE